MFDWLQLFTLTIATALCVLLTPPRTNSTAQVSVNNCSQSNIQGALFYCKSGRFFIVKTGELWQTKSMVKKHNNIFARMAQRLHDDNEKGSRQALLEELFNDFNRNRYEIYKINFFRGIFFGFGSLLGGTMLIVLLVWVLNLTGQLVPSVAGFIDQILNVMQNSRR
jgi:hypothetical protein